MDSLYGGKPGAPFIIKATFASVDLMTTSFKKGASYTDVWYGEYCLISTANKNSKDNGKIYKRGYNYQATNGGAEYIGQIVGPSSGTPYFTLGDLEHVQTQAKSTLAANSYRRFPVSYDKTTKKYTTTDDSSKTLGTFEFNATGTTPSLVPGKVTKDGVTTYNDSIKYTWCNIRQDNADADSWFYVGFQLPYAVTDFTSKSISPYDANGDIISSAATVTKTDDGTHPFYASWLLGVPKGIKGDALRNMRVITPTTDKKIYDISSLKIDAATGTVSVSGLKEYDGKADDVTKKRQILVFDYYYYDKAIAPEGLTFYVGDYNLINNITLADDGTLSITYTHNDATTYSKKIKWISSFSLTTGTGSQGGHLAVVFNDGTKYENDLSWVKDISVSDDGTVTYTYAGAAPGETAATATGVKTQSNLIKWIKSVGLTQEGAFTVNYNNGTDPYKKTVEWIDKITLDPETGKMVIKYNTGRNLSETTLNWVKDATLSEDGTLTFVHTNLGEISASNKIKWITSATLSATTGALTVIFNDGTAQVSQLDWIKGISIDESTGVIKITHSNNTLNDADNNIVDGVQTLNAKLKLIKEAAVDSTGIITLYTNTGDNFTVKNKGANTDYHLKSIENISLSSNIADDKHIYIKYNTDSAATAIGNSINIIQDMVVRSTDYHLLVLYSDPNHRAIEADLDSSGMATQVASSESRYKYIYKSGPWVSGVTNSQGTTYDSAIYWRDYGPIKDQSGILVGFNLTKADIGEKDILEYLDETFPSGLTSSTNQPGGAAVKEKIITYGTDDSADKEFYAFDYAKYKWYYLGKIADSGSRDVKLVDKSTVTDEDRKALNTKGLMFYSAAVSTKKTGIPRYWASDYTFVE